jgi:guanylate kinase
MGTIHAMSIGLLVVMSGPSGVGKTTIAHRLQTAINAVFSVSATTRKAGPGEIDGRDYHFVSPDQFDRMRAAGEFLEYAEVFGKDCYGTPREPVDSQLGAGRVVLLDIDVQGASQVRAAMPDACMLFVEPPDEETLRQRLTDRGRDTADAIERRLAEARRELDAARAPGLYDRFIVNDDLDRATDVALAEIQARLKDKART